MVDGVDVQAWVVKIGWCRVDELRAGALEEFLEDGQAVGTATLQFCKFLAVLLAQGRVDAVVQAGGGEGHADGDQGVHLLRLFGDGVELALVGALLEVLCA